MLPLDAVVINTEAHIFPRFELGKLFSTGWKRKERGPDGRIVQQRESQTATGGGEESGSVVKVREVRAEGQGEGETLMTGRGFEA